MTEIEEVTQFIYREARLADDHAYDEWESLWADDGVYWIPANGEGGDPEHEMSILYDNRSRIALRVRQFHTGKRFSQTPLSGLRRVVSNVELLGRETDEKGEALRVTCNVMLFEAATRGDVVWGSRTEYRLRRQAEGLRMAMKKVVLVNNAKPLWSMAFLM